MNLRSTLLTTKTDVSKGHAMSVGLQRIPQYIIFAGLGVLGGATGTALAFGLAIAIQWFLSPTTTFWPSVILLALAATLFGWVISWPLGQATYRTLPNLSNTNTVEKGMQVILIFSGLTSLLETYLYMYGLDFPHYVQQFQGLIA